ncbi:MAG: hypothetical protein AB7F96_16940 [Beijerinckiaceae bacterium]
MPQRAIVFAPYIERDGKLYSEHYDLPGYRAEISDWMTALGVDWEWRPVCSANLQRELARAATAMTQASTVVFNLCDGTEADGYPGIEVVEGLANAGIPYTGADPEFYRVTTSKAISKKLFAAAGVSTAPYFLLQRGAADLDAAIDAIGFPLFIKPDVSAGSYGIQVDSVCRDRAAAERKIGQLLSGLHGQHFEKNGILAEAFVEGREFTVLAVEDPGEPMGLKVVPAGERVFDKRVPPEERFLAFERYWELPEDNRRLPPGEPYYWYELAPAPWRDELATLTRKAMRAVGGNGYARADIRYDEARKMFFVLEVNAQCGLSADDSATVGSMLRLSGLNIVDIIERVLAHASTRRAAVSAG